MRRFRPNILVETSAGIEGFTEFDWCGRELRLGQVAGDVVMPMMRCAMTTHAQGDLPKEPAIMRTLVRDAEMNFGAAITVTGAGTVEIGDVVELR